MKCAGSCGLFKSFASVGGLMVAGLGGYNAITTGCVFGTCDADASLRSSLVPASDVLRGGGCCGLSELEACSEAPCETEATDVAAAAEIGSETLDTVVPAAGESVDAAPTGG